MPGALHSETLENQCQVGHPCPPRRQRRQDFRVWHLLRALGSNRGKVSGFGTCFMPSALPEAVCRPLIMTPVAVPLGNGSR